MRKSIIIALTLAALVFASCSKNVIKPVYFEVELPEQGHFAIIQASTEQESKTISIGESEIIVGRSLTLFNMSIKDTKVLVGGKEYMVKSEGKLNLK